VKFRESLVSAHHNYLVNQMLSPGFVIGNPDSREEFYFLADAVPPGKRAEDLLSVYDAQGNFVLEAEPERIKGNPLGCLRHSFSGDIESPFLPGRPFSAFRPKPLHGF